MLLLYILLALLGQQTTVNGQQTPFFESENLKTSESEKSREPRAMSHETFLESEESVNISEICGNEKTNHRFTQKKSEKSCEQRAMSNEPFSETEKSVNISEICGNEKTNHKLVQKKSEKGCEQRAMSHETFLESENLKTSESEKRLKSQGRNAQSSQHEAQSLKKTVDCCPLTVDYFENQIRLADSLYKNYLPQYNFEEVKAAMEFFDSLRLTTDNSQQTTDFFHRFRKNKSSQYLSNSQTLCNSDAYPRTVDCCPLTVDIEFLCARAHYYHAVGLTERDDIVGACEHYLTALEIMEFETENLRTSKSEKRSQSRKVARSQSDCLSDSATQILCDRETLRPCDLNNEDYEKIRFLALTYTRLGRLFYDENYCDLAILKYKKALKHYNIINDTTFVSYSYKSLGNSYQLDGKYDSALYHYNKSLKLSHNLTNKIDVDKSIALILFNKGKKDSAYVMITNNLNMIDNINVRHSYYNTLGEMFVEDKEYDSAVYYLTKSINSNISDIKVNSAIKLSAIYDSIGDDEKKVYYNEIISKISINDVNKSLKNYKIQDVYNRYKERKAEKEKIKSRTRTKVIAISLSLLIIVSFVIIILIWHKSKRKDRIHQESLNEKDRYIADKEEIISRIDKEIKQKESEIKELVEIIGNLKSDINSLKNEVDTKEEEISCKGNDIKKMENDLSAKERELKRLQENVHENRILIDRLNEDNIAKEKQIECYLEEIDDNRQVINDKNHLISIATEGLVARKDAIAENRNEIARLQAIIDENDKIIKELSEDHETNEKRITVHLGEIEKLKTEINQVQNNLKDLRFKNSLTEGRIKSQNAELKKKEELIRKYTTEISNLKYRSERNHVDISNLNNYLQSDICSKILNEIKDISEKKLKSNMLSPLSKAEFVLLLDSANHYLNHLINDMAKKYPKLKKEDLYYLCLVIIGLNNHQISSLYGVTYHASNKRKHKICVILGLDSKENLYNHLSRLID